LEHFDPKWLLPYTRIIIDGIHDADDIEARLLKKITEQGNALCLIDAPSLDALKRAGEFHPLRITKDFISRISLMPREDASVTNADDLFLAESLFSDRLVSLRSARRYRCSRQSPRARRCRTLPVK
jgi:hypothetical protein